METARFGKNVVRVIRLDRDQTGKYNPVVIHEQDTKKRKRSKGPLGVVDRAVRNLADAQQAFASSYASRHDESNSDSRDGWIKDFPVNVFRAQQKGLKKLRLSRVLDI